MKPAFTDVTRDEHQTMIHLGSAGKVACFARAYRCLDEYYNESWVVCMKWTNDGNEQTTQSFAVCPTRAAAEAAMRLIWDLS